jgi:hypothetical protein
MRTVGTVTLAGVALAVVAIGMTAAISGIAVLLTAVLR